MSLLLNYLPVLRQPTGIGVYANAVLPTLQQIPHHLVTGGDEGRAKERLKRLAWTQFELPNLALRHDASLIFTPAPEGYLGPQRIPQVVMVHDLRPISHPELSLQSLYFRSWVPPLLKTACHVLTNSRFTASEIQRYTGLSDDRIEVIPLGYNDEVFCPGSPLQRLDEAPYLLHVGQAYPHKNLRRLIQAFSQIVRVHPQVKLVLAGKPHLKETPQLIRLVTELGLLQQVEFLPYVPYTALAALYQGALALVYPSLWEGFGLPVVEAMACGTPVVTSIGSGTEEVAGDAALLVNPYDTNELASVLLALIDQRSLQDQYRSRGFARASKFSWKATGEATCKILKSYI